MTWFNLFVLGFSMLIGSSIQISTPESMTYVAGVVEYNQEPVNYTNPDSLFEENANRYIAIINSTEASDVDIIVFPALCLNAQNRPVLLPENIDVDLCSAPNTNYSQDLRRIACAARDLEKYVVLNLYIRNNCSTVYNMKHNGTALACSVWNGNIVLDRTGKVISTYRNLHLSDGSWYKDARPEVSTFTTDFGVTFGHFTSSDILFELPAMDLIAKGIKNIIFPTKWFSELPFLSAVQIQQNWAYANDVNLLAAGHNNPSNGSSGSGIFSSKSGALISIMTGDNTTRLLVHKVPKNPVNRSTRNEAEYFGSNLEHLKMRQDSLDGYSFRNLQLPNSTAIPLNDSFTLCSKDDLFCCNFDVNVTLRLESNNSVSYTYMAAVFNGDSSLNNINQTHIRTCAILACKNGDTKSCGQRHHETSNKKMHLESKFSFERIVIRGHFPESHTLTMPNTLNFNTLTSYPVADFIYKEVINASSSNKEISISLEKPKNDLYTFSIYSLASSTSTITAPSNTMILTVIVICFVLFVCLTVCLCIKCRRNK